MSSESLVIHKLNFEDNHKTPEEFINENPDTVKKGHFIDFLHSSQLKSGRFMVDLW